MENSMCRCCPIDSQDLIQLVRGRVAPLPIVAQLNDPLYINWLKSTQGLMLTVEELRRFCDAEMKKLHSQLENKCGRTQCSGSCSSRDVKEVRRKWTIPSCSTGVCSTWLAAIEQERTHTKTMLTVTNSDIQQWPRESWQIAKVFMGWGQVATSVKSSDTDASGLLGLIRNCRHFGSVIDTTKADAVSITHTIAYIHWYTHWHTLITQYLTAWLLKAAVSPTSYLCSSNFA